MLLSVRIRLILNNSRAIIWSNFYINAAVVFFKCFIYQYCRPNRTCHHLGESIIFLFLCIFLNSSEKLLPYLHLKRRSANTNICLITLETHLVRMSKILKTVGWINCESRRSFIITGKFSPFLQSFVQNKNDDEWELL